MIRFGFVFACVIAFFVAPAVAQNSDRIIQKDGQVFPSETSNQKINVISETFKDVEYELETGGIQVTQKMDISKVDRVVYGRHRAYAAAKELFDAGDYEAAIAELEPLTTRDSPHWVKQYSLFYTAEALSRLGDDAAAIKAYEKLQSEVPDSVFVPMAQLRIGQALVRQNKLEDARKIFNSLKRDTDSKGYDPVYEYRAQLGIIGLDEKTGNFSVAKSELEKLQAQVGDQYPSIAAECRLRIGNVFIREGDYRKAQDYFQAILESGSSDKSVVYGAYNGLGQSYFAQSKFKEALQDCYLRVVIIDDRTGGVPVDVLAESLYWSGRCWDQLRSEAPEYARYARDLYREVIRRAPGSYYAGEARKQIRR